MSKDPLSHKPRVSVRFEQIEHSGGLLDARYRTERHTMVNGYDKASASFWAQYPGKSIHFSFQDRRSPQSNIMIVFRAVPFLVCSTTLSISSKPHRDEIT